MYFLHGKLTEKAGHTQQLAEILIEASQLMATAQGCKLYVVSKDVNDLNSVYVTEIWTSKEAHNDSLNLEGVKELIMKVMPILEGAPVKGQTLEIIGGAGI